MQVTFYYESAIRIRQIRRLKSFIADIFKKEGKQLNQLTYIFCSDEYLLQINKQFLKHDFYTDIISFDLSENARAPILGEIYISTDRVKDNATIHHSSVEQELHRVIFHGALHLCGYKDKQKQQQLTMRSKEDFYLSAYGLL